MSDAYCQACWSRPCLCEARKTNSLARETFAQDKREQHARAIPRMPWVASDQYGMRFIASQDNEIILRADWMPMEVLRAMVDAANSTQSP